MRTVSERRATATMCLLALTFVGVAALVLVILLAARTLPDTAALVGPFCSSLRDKTPTFTLDLWIVLPLVAAALAWAAGTLRLWRRCEGARGLLARRSAAYATGWLALFAALVSPVHYLGSRLFSVHMIEHEIVMAVAAPLLVIARPLAATLWALPRGARGALARFLEGRVARRAWQVSTGGASATLLHGAALWLWHVPLFFETALANAALHRAQHLVFFVTALLFWWSMLRRCQPGRAAAHVFLTMLHMSVLGALIALVPHVLFVAQTAGASAFGLTPLEDQQLAGLVMWVPAGTIYAGACLALAAAWVKRAGRSAWKPSHALAPR